MKDLDDTPDRAALIGRMIDIMQDEMPMLYGWSEEFGGAYHQWVGNGKPSNIIRDNLPYLRIDPQLRTSKIKEWNQAIWWPLAILPLMLLAVAWPSWKAWRRRQSHAIRSRFCHLHKEHVMFRFLTRKLAYGFAILIGINLLTFVLFFKVNTPDDMARMQLGCKRVTSDAIEKWKAERGYDRPLCFNEKL